MLEGTDQSHYQGAIDWHAVAGSGRAFGICKATEGLAVDSTFAANWAGMAAAGRFRGAYHFGHPAIDAGQQAHAFLHVVQPHTGDLLALDLEVGDGHSPDQLGAWSDAFVTAIHDLCGTWPLLYTGAWFWGAVRGAHVTEANCPLWVSSYRPAPSLPPAWKSWAIHQYSDAGQVPGVPGRCDVDRTPLTDLHQLGVGHPSPAIPPYPAPLPLPTLEVDVLDIAQDVVMHPDGSGRGYVLDDRGGIHPCGPAGNDLPVPASDYWPADNPAARRLVVLDWSKPSGYVLDKVGGLHPFGGAPADSHGADHYWG